MLISVHSQARTVADIAVQNIDKTFVYIMERTVSLIKRNSKYSCHEHFRNCLERFAHLAHSQAYLRLFIAIFTNQAL